MPGLLNSIRPALVLGPLGALGVGCPGGTLCGYAVAGTGG